MNKNMKYGYEVERAIVAEIVARYQKEGMSHVEFAKILYGDTPTSSTKWRRIRNTSPTGKPQSLPVFEAVAAAEILGLNFYSLAFQIEERSRSRTVNLPTLTFSRSYYRSLQ